MPDKKHEEINTAPPLRGSGRFKDSIGSRRNAVGGIFAVLPPTGISAALRALKFRLPLRGGVVCLILALLSACMDNISLQRQYVHDRDECRQVAEQKMGTYTPEGGTPLDDKNGKQKNAALLSLFSECMKGKDWAVSGPKKDKDKDKAAATPAASPAAPAATVAAAPAAPAPAAAPPAVPPGYMLVPVAPAPAPAPYYAPQPQPAPPIAGNGAYYMPSAAPRPAPALAPAPDSQPPSLQNIINRP